MPAGTVHSITVSNGGVPKISRSSAMMTKQGLEGDRQRDRRYHGGPDRAVCLFSWDLMQQLKREGHPIVEGSIGENLTLAGIDWTVVKTGLRLQIGEAVVEITETATPCRNIADSFAGPFTRVSQKTHPGWSRWYARVIREGPVTVGDRVVLDRAELDRLPEVVETPVRQE
jgi:MOSC domain-containing protein YiiM